MRYIAIVAMSLLLAAGLSVRPAAAAGAESSAPARAASAVENALSGQGIKITGELPAPDGFHGFVGSYRGKQIPVYTTPDGEHLVVGSLFDMNGNDLTSPALRKAADSRLGDKQWQQLADASWVAEGAADADRVVYAFMDPDCPYCHQFWKASQKWVKDDGNVQVRNIMVAVITPESMPRAAGILGADDPTAAWRNNETQYDADERPAAPSDPPAAAKQKVRKNNVLMQQLGFHGTPAIIYKDADGDIHSINGMPRSQQMLEGIFEP